VSSNHQDRSSSFFLLHPRFLTSPEILKIPDPSVSEIEPSGFAELDSTKQTVALCIGQKLDYPVWWSRTSDFSRKPNLTRFDRKPDACCAKSFANVFASVENWTIRFGDPEHLIFPENQILLDSIENLMLAAPNRSPMYFHPWK
jgi:hypothetical protein